MRNNSSLYRLNPDGSINEMLVYEALPEPIAGSAGRFDGLIVGESNIPKTRTDFVQFTGRFKLIVVCSFTNGSSTTDADFVVGTTRSLSTPAYGWRVQYSNRLSGIEGQLGFFWGINVVTTIYTDDISQLLEDGKQHELEFEAVIDAFRISVDGNVVKEAAPLITTVTTSDEQLWVGKSADGFNYNHQGLISSIQLYDAADNDVVYIPFAEESELKWYDAATFRSKGSYVDVLLNGSPKTNQFEQNGNKTYHHNLQFGYNVGGIFDGNTGGKYAEPDDTNTDWQLQGFKVELQLIIDSDTGAQVFFAIARNETANAGGFIIGQSNDQLVIGAAQDATGILFPFLTVIAITPGNGYDIKVWKRPNSATVNFTVNENSGSGNLGSSTIYYNPSGQSVSLGNWYDYQSLAYALQTPATIKKIRLTEIDDSDVELREIIVNDWLNGTETEVLNTARNRINDMIWVDGVGKYTGKIPGDRGNFGFDIDGNEIVNKSQVIQYRSIYNYIRRPLP